MLISDKIVELTDTLIVGIFMGPGAVALYSVPQRLVQYSQMLFIKASEVLFPKFSQLHALEDRQGLREHWINGYKYLLAFAMPINMVFLFWEMSSRYCGWGSSFERSTQF